MLIPSALAVEAMQAASLSRRVNANSQLMAIASRVRDKLIKKGEC